MIHPWPGMQSPPPPPAPSLKKGATRLTRARESMRAGRPGTQAALDRWRNITGPPAEDPKAEGRVASLLGINGVFWSPSHPATVGSDLVDHWVAHRGLAYATRALCASHALEVTYEGKLVPNSQPDSLSMSGWKTLRAYLAVDPAYESAREAAGEFWPDAPLGLAVALAYAFPTAQEWVHEALERAWGQGSFPPQLCSIIASFWQAPQLERFVELPAAAAEYVPSAVDRIGPQCAPCLIGWLSCERSIPVKRVLGATLAAIRSPEVTAFMAARLKDNPLGHIAASYLATAQAN